MLQQEEDFKENQKSDVDKKLEELCKARNIKGEGCLLPKSHPELNPIERLWSWIKRCSLIYDDSKVGASSSNNGPQQLPLRLQQIDFLSEKKVGSPAIRQRLLDILRQVNQMKVQNYCSRFLTWCWMYKSGRLNYMLARRACKKYKRHRQDLSEAEYKALETEFDAEREALRTFLQNARDNKDEEDENEGEEREEILADPEEQVDEDDEDLWDEDIDFPDE